MRATSDGSPPFAVLLAAGRGSRMARPDPSVRLSAEQEAAADRGLKSLVPFHGRPYLAYALHEVAEAGFEDACLVVGPGDHPVRALAETLETARLRLHFAVQREPRGLADAVLAAEPVVGDTPFVVLNADNIYPADVLARVRALDGPGLAGFDRGALVAESNYEADRVAAFAVVEAEEGVLRRVIEKPDAATLRARADAPVSMTCWRFDRAIFDACRDIAPSPRGELEITDAVQRTMERGVRYRVVPVAAGVIDISHRGDIPGVERMLAGRDVRL